MTHRVAHITVLLLFIIFGAGISTASEPVAPRRVLITNDNGIDDPKLIALARAFSETSETWVVAPATDRSGTSNRLSITQIGAVRVTERDFGPKIRAFAVDGFPADCVVVALLGLMLNDPPDLVVSGINGGPNLGAEWMFSGTVGAARVAAFAGFPALAVSGLDDDLPEAVEAAVEWVVRLASTDAVRGQRPGEYLTVSLPRVAPAEINGIAIVDRAPLIRIPKLEFDDDAMLWRVTGADQTGLQPATCSDEAIYAEHRIAIVPMRVEEVDGERLGVWRKRPPALPSWRLVAHGQRSDSGE